MIPSISKPSIWKCEEERWKQKQGDLSSKQYSTLIVLSTQTKDTKQHVPMLEGFLWKNVSSRDVLSILPGWKVLKRYPHQTTIPPRKKMSHPTLPTQQLCKKEVPHYSIGATSGPWISQHFIYILFQPFIHLKNENKRQNTTPPDNGDVTDTSRVALSLTGDECASSSANVLRQLCSTLCVLFLN